MNKTFFTLLTGTILANFAVSNINLPKTFAQEIQTISVAQSPSQIQFRNITGFNGKIVNLEISPNGEDLVVTSSDGKVALIDSETLEPKYFQAVLANPYSNISFNSKGDLFAVTSQNDIVLYDTETGNVVRTFRGHLGKVNSVAMSPDDRVLVSVSGSDSTVKVWDVESGRLIKDVSDILGTVRNVAFSPDNTYFVTGSVGTDRVLQFWDAKTFELINTSDKQGGFINSIDFSPNGNRLVAAVRNYIKVWDLNLNREILNIKGPQLELNQAVISPDNRLVATANKEGTIMLIDINQGKILGTLEGHKGWVQSVTFSPDGKTLYSGAEDKVVKVWDVSKFY